MYELVAFSTKPDYIGITLSQHAKKYPNSPLYSPNTYEAFSGKYVIPIKYFSATLTLNLFS